MADAMLKQSDSSRHPLVPLFNAEGDRLTTDAANIMAMMTELIMAISIMLT